MSAKLLSRDAAFRKAAEIVATSKTKWADATMTAPTGTDGGAGGTGETGTGAPAATDGDLDDAALQAAIDAAKDDDTPVDKEVGPNGYPLGTSVKDMAAEHQAAYWKHLARQHERRAKAVKPTSASTATSTSSTPDPTKTDPAATAGDPALRQVLQNRERTEKLTAAVTALVKPEFHSTALDSASLKAKLSDISIDPDTLLADPGKAKSVVEEWLKGRDNFKIDPEKAKPGSRLPGTVNAGAGKVTSTTGRRSLADAIGAKMRGED